MIRSFASAAFVLLLLGSGSMTAFGEKKAEPKKGKKSGKVTVEQPPSVDDVYVVQSNRDPFIPLIGGWLEFSGDTGGKAPDTEEAKKGINIHELELKGMMGSGKARMAIIFDPSKQVSYILKKGRLFDRKKKKVPGISGVIQGKSVLLMTKDKDVQWLKLEKPSAEEGAL